MDKILAPIKQRIIKFIEFKGFEKIKYYEKLGASASNFRSTSLKSEIGGEVIAKILSLNSDLSSDWLLTGKEPMIKEADIDIFKNRKSNISAEERKRQLFNSFGDIASGDEKLQVQITNIAKINEMLMNQISLQQKVIDGLEFKIEILEKDKPIKYLSGEPIVYQNMAERAPELIKKKR